MILKTDCKHFPGNKPCSPSKTEGKKCDDCNYYEPVEFKILIIKLDATGDVLRTTSILPALKREYPKSHITWLTKKNAKELFNNNPFVDELIIFEENDIVPRLLVEKFDILIHPDASVVSASLASIVNAEIKKGFLLDAKGKVIPVNDDAVEWLEMGAFDDMKKKNQKTYQEIIHNIAGLKYQKNEIQLRLNQKEIDFKNDFFSKHNLIGFKYLVGLNTGAGTRWQYKQWRIEGYIELIEKLSKNKEIGILLYGGPDEVGRNKILKNKFPHLIDTGTNNSLRQFFSLLDLCDVLVTSDTMALHAATALKKKIVCLFGPTSNTEIEDYGRIEKVIPDLDCLVCYKPKCDFEITCMGSITSDMVYEKVMESINQLKKTF
ncbi:MAG TPA: glycosyltransferase family 9 protein [Ignavibacteriaceae bacterium]|nr:glycosyltransferase family 9 protein [Ignavibacteriaceae bacterium]